MAYTISPGLNLANRIEDYRKRNAGYCASRNDAIEAMLDELELLRRQNRALRGADTNVAAWRARAQKAERKNDEFESYFRNGVRLVA